MRVSVVTNPEHGEFVAAGYYLVAPTPRPDWAPGASCSAAGRLLLPPTVLTLSPCLTVLVPDGWPSPTVPGWRPNDEKLRRLGIDPARADAIEAWAEDAWRAEPETWPRPFFDVTTAREFARRFVDDAADLFLVGASLPEDHVERFLAEAAGCATERMHAVLRALRPEPGGRLVGYEVLGDGLHEAHSILCSGAEVELHDELGLVPNEHGLFATLEDAVCAAARVTAGLGEPVTYYPWRLEVYDR